MDTDTSICFDCRSWGIVWRQGRRWLCQVCLQRTLINATIKKIDQIIAGRGV